MDTTIRNLDEWTYRELKARAALEGRTIGEVVNEAIRSYLERQSGGDDRVVTALGAIGSLPEEEAEALEESVRRLRRTWR